MKKVLFLVFAFLSFFAVSCSYGEKEDKDSLEGTIWEFILDEGWAKEVHAIKFLWYNFRV